MGGWHFSSDGISSKWSSEQEYPWFCWEHKVVHPTIGLLHRNFPPFFFSEQPLLHEFSASCWISVTYFLQLFIYEITLRLKSLLVVRSIVIPVCQRQLIEVFLRKRHMSILIRCIRVLIAVCRGCWEIWHYDQRSGEI